MVLSCNEDHYYDRIWYLQWESTRNVDVACSLTMQLCHVSQPAAWEEEDRSFLARLCRLLHHAFSSDLGRGTNSPKVLNFMYTIVVHLTHLRHCTQHQSGGSFVWYPFQEYKTMPFASFYAHGKCTWISIDPILSSVWERLLQQTRWSITCSFPLYVTATGISMGWTVSSMYPQVTFTWDYLCLEIGILGPRRTSCCHIHGESNRANCVSIPRKPCDQEQRLGFLSEQYQYRG